MKLKAWKCFAVLLIVVVSSFGQKQSKSTTWKVDNVDKIGGQEVTVSGHPQIIEAPGGKAIAFDGVGDSLLLNANPLAGAEAFTLEAVFRPDAGGAKEQRTGGVLHRVCAAGSIGEWPDQPCYLPGADQQ